MLWQDRGSGSVDDRLAVFCCETKQIIHRKFEAGFPCHTEVISFTSSGPSIPRTGLRFDIHNEKRSCQLFKGYCRSLAKSLLVFSGKERCFPAASLKNSNLDGHKRKADVSGHMRAERKQNDLNCCSFFLPV